MVWVKFPFRNNMEKTTSSLAYYLQLACSGTNGDVDLILKDLNSEMSFKDLRGLGPGKKGLFDGVS